MIRSSFRTVALTSSMLRDAITWLACFLSSSVTAPSPKLDSQIRVVALYRLQSFRTSTRVASE